MVVGHVPPLPLVRFRFWVRVGLGLASRKGWVGTWPATRLDPTKHRAITEKKSMNPARS